MTRAHLSIERGVSAAESVPTARVATEVSRRASHHNWPKVYGAVMLVASGLVAGCAGSVSPADGCKYTSSINDLENPDRGNPILLTPGRIPFTLLLSRHNANTVGVGMIISQKGDPYFMSSFRGSDAIQIDLKIPTNQSASTWTKRIGVDTVEVVVTHGEVQSSCVSSAVAAAAQPQS